MAPPGPSPTLRAERACWRSGDRVVCGIDEVGRGSWAGPVTVAAVVPPDEHLAGVDLQVDSVEDDEVAEALGHLLEANHRAVGGRRRRAAAR